MQTRATVFLDQHAIRYEARTYEHTRGAASFGLEAAELLGLDPAIVFKTLIARLDGDRAELVTAIVPVDSMLDLRALARAAGAKRAQMAPMKAAERSSGYVAGGISPFAQRTQLTTFIDETAEICDTIWVSGGQRGLDIGVDPRDLIQTLNAQVAAIAD